MCTCTKPWFSDRGLAALTPNQFDQCCCTGGLSVESSRDVLWVVIISGNHQQNRQAYCQIAIMMFYVKSYHPSRVWFSLSEVFNLSVSSKYHANRVAITRSARWWGACTRGRCTRISLLPSARVVCFESRLSVCLSVHRGGSQVNKFEQIHVVGVSPCSRRWEPYIYLLTSGQLAFNWETFLFWCCSVCVICVNIRLQSVILLVLIRDMHLYLGYYIFDIFRNFRKQWW